VVTAGSFAAGDSKNSNSTKFLDVATTAGSNAEHYCGFKTPGANRLANRKGLAPVRWIAGYETKQFIDGTLVNNTSVPDIASHDRFSYFL